MLYTGKEIPEKIQEPGYDKANKNLFKIEPFKEEEDKEDLNKFNKYLKEVEDKNY